MSTTINFLQRDEKDKKRAEAMRAIVMPITTAVVVVYLILVSSLLGWWWWWSSKQQQVSAEYAALRGQVDSKLQTELLARRMIDRIDVINNYLKSRKDLKVENEFLQDQPYNVSMFGLDLEGYFFVEVEATESATVALVEEDLKQRYQDVLVKSMIWDNKKGLWAATYWYRGGKL